MPFGGRAWVSIYLGVGLVFQVLFFGVPWPLHLPTWLHVLGWPVFLMLGLVRRLFMVFALLVLFGLGVAALVGRRRRAR